MGRNSNRVWNSFMMIVVLSLTSETLLADQETNDMEPPDPWQGNAAGVE